jgi:hypothetical protein
VLTRNEDRAVVFRQKEKGQENRLDYAEKNEYREKINFIIHGCRL